VVYITSRRFTPRTANPTYVKVYSNCDNVELFINGVSKGVLTSADHIYKWTSGLTLTAGANEIRAVGRIGASEYTDVCNWDVVPVVTITSPTEGAALPVGNILIQATASEIGGGTITTVEFYNGSTYLGADTTAPYSFTWASVPNGCYTIKAKAIDNIGGSTTASVSIRVGTGCGPAPHLTMQILAVGASGYQEGNPPENTIDGSMTTRWACQGIGSFIYYDLGFVREIQGVKIAFYSGNTRRSYFDICVYDPNSPSDPNSPYYPLTPVLTGGISSGTTSDFEEFDFPATSAPYLFIIAYGNSGGNWDWNSYYEVEICGPLFCTDVLACGLKFDADLSGPAGTPDCRVDFYDLAVMAADWMQSDIPAGGGNISGPAGIPDNRVDFYDLAAMVAYWLECNIPDDPTCVF
jgi:hypothetical protein